MSNFSQKIKKLKSDIKTGAKILRRQISDFFKSLGNRISGFFKKCGTGIKKFFTFNKRKNKQADKSGEDSIHNENQAAEPKSASKNNKTAANSAYSQTETESSENEQKETVDSTNSQTEASTQQETSCSEDEKTNSDSKNAQSAKEETSEAKSGKPRRHSVIYAIGSIFDVLFDVLFAAGIILRLKPNLLELARMPKLNDEVTAMLKRILIEISFYPPKKVAELQPEIIFLLFCIIASFIIFKLVFALFVAHGPQKLVSVLLVAATVFTLTLTMDKFLIFVAFYFLLYYTYEISCGISPKTAGIKMSAVIILDILMYIILHAVSCPESFEFLRLPVSGWI